MEIALLESKDEIPLCNKTELTNNYSEIEYGMCLFCGCIGFSNIYQVQFISMQLCNCSHFQDCHICFFPPKLFLLATEIQVRLPGLSHGWLASKLPPPYPTLLCLLFNANVISLPVILTIPEHLPDSFLNPCPWFIPLFHYFSLHTMSRIEFSLSAHRAVVLIHVISFMLSHLLRPFSGLVKYSLVLLTPIYEAAVKIVFSVVPESVVSVHSYTPISPSHQNYAASSNQSIFYCQHLIYDTSFSVSVI